MATSSPSSVTQAAFHADDVEQSAGYRTVSVLAIISLIFGLASPLCFAGPLLMAVPLFGAAISILALRQIAASEEALAGRWAAVIGLFLCIASGVAMFSRDVTVRSMRLHQAREFGENWIATLLSGKLEDAFRLTVDGNRPPPPPEPGMPPPKSTPYDLFKEQPVIKSLVAAGANAQIHFKETITYQPQAGRNVVARQQFAIAPSPAADSKSADARPVEIVLSVQRAHLSTETGSRWLVSSVEDARATSDKQTPK
jgi:hypothetical protein